MSGEATVVSWGGRSNGEQGTWGTGGPGHRHSGGAQGRARAGGDHGAKGRASPQTSAGLGGVRGGDAQTTGPCVCPPVLRRVLRRGVERKKEPSRSPAKRTRVHWGHWVTPVSGWECGKPAPRPQGAEDRELQGRTPRRDPVQLGHGGKHTGFPVSRGLGGPAAPSFRGEDDPGVRRSGTKETTGKGGFGRGNGREGGDD